MYSELETPASIEKLRSPFLSPLHVVAPYLDRRPSGDDIVDALLAAFDW